MVNGTKAKLVHHGNGTCTHRDDVTDDSTHTGGSTLEGLDVAGVVVALHLKGDSPALADIDNTGILAHADHQLFFHLLADLLAKLTKVNLRRLVGAVLTPHHRIHRQLTGGGAATEDFTNLGVLVILEAKGAVGLNLVGGCDGVLYGVGDVAAHA